MTERERKVLEKLPAARRYLRAARWGLDALLSQKAMGAGYLFHAIGLLSALRACQSVLYKSDRKLSPRHDEVITEWWQSTKDFKQFPELDFITKARNTILKDASFPSYATRSEGSWEGAGIDYETAHYLDGERRDLEIDVRAAMDWFERQLAEIEAKLPTRYEDDEPHETDDFAGMDLTSIPPETIAATTTAPSIEDGVVINFARRPRPYWQPGDIIEVFHKPSGRTTLTATESWPMICTWKSESIPTKRFDIQRVDDQNYRVVQVPGDRAE